MLISGLGISIFSWNLLFALTVMVFVGSYAGRILAEEAFMKHRFETQYVQYIANTGRLVPRMRKRG
jgi:protein-S-isoprenylcysteine O-methyltransferase Ste14